jgi:hypothetical protein
MAIVNKKIFIGILLLLLFNFSEATVSASVDRSNLSQGQNLTLSIDITDSNGSPNIDGLRNDFDIYGTSTSSQTSIINGSISSKKTFIVNLLPKKPGKQTIPPISVGNETTSPIEINVTETSTAEQVDQDSQVFVEAKSQSKSTYIGVPIVYIMKLYYSVSLNNLQMSNLNIPDAEIKSLGKESRYSEKVNGNNYDVIELKLLITPKKAGTLSIPPVKISGLIAGDNMGDIFAMARAKPFNITSKPQSLSVKDIPSSSNKATWLPAKQLNMNEIWSVNSPTLKIGQPVSRTILVQAIGNSSTAIPEINVATPKGINAYPDKPVNDDSVNSDGLVGTKTFKITYIPTKSGNIEFPSVTVKWWDINSDSYKTAIVPAKSYAVVDENGQMAAESKPIQVTPASAAVKKPLTKSTKQHNSLSWYYIAVAFIVLLLIALIIIVIRRKIRTASDNGGNPPTNKLTNEKKSFTQLQKTFASRDLNLLNTALIHWASIHWQRKIYTVSDIAELTNNEKISNLINKFNQALYRGETFTEFEALEHEIEIIARAKQQSKQGAEEELKEFYPK